VPGARGIENYLGLLGSIEIARGRFDEAESLLLRAVEVGETSWATDALARSAMGLHLLRLGQVYHLKGEYEPANSTLKCALPYLAGPLADECRAELKAVRRARNRA
jgi:hypothetical protein